MIQLRVWKNKSSNPTSRTNQGFFRRIWKKWSHLDISFLLRPIHQIIGVSCLIIIDTEGLKKKIIELLDEIKDIEAAEEEAYGENDLEEMGEGKEINAEELKEVAERINEKLNQDPKNRQLKKAKQLLEKEYIPRQEKYEEQEQKLNGQNSFSKTDPAAHERGSFGKWAIETIL